MLANSGEFNGMDSKTAKTKITDWLGEKDLARSMINYKLRDWVFSRQRYWGEPIPLVHCAKCGVVAVPEDQLPLRLPPVERLQPTGTANRRWPRLTNG